MKPVFSQETVPGGESLPVCLTKVQNCQDVSEAARRVRASFTICGMAFSLGISGGLFSSADAAVTTKVSVSTSATGIPSIRASYGSDRSVGASAVYHTVAQGETVWAIAEQHGVAVEAIRALNGIATEQVIQVGQVLRVPSATEPVNRSEVSIQSENVVASTLIQSVEADRLRSPEVIQSAPEVAESSSPLQLGDGSWESMSISEIVSPTKAIAPENTLTLPTPEVLPTKAEESLPGELITDEPSETVSEGDTVWSIAQIHDIDPDLLARVNEIDDAALILPGDELIIPEPETVIDSEPESEELQADEVREEKDADDLNSVPSVRALESTSTVETSASPIAATNNQPTDPYVAGLVAEVTAATRETQPVVASRHTVATVAPESQLHDEADPSGSAETIGLSSPEVTNPQFPGVPNDSNLEDELDTSAFSSEELLAAAPLGSEVYAPVLERPEGRVVSPDMPILPGQDEYLPEAPASTQINGYLWPAQGVLTSGYGWRWGRMHRGIDVAGPVGTPIFAAAPGVVTRSGWNSGGYGNLVEIRHSDGSMTRYAHNSRNVVANGQQVSQGQKIAEMGSTGYSTGPHLHFEIHLPNQGAVNPMALLPGR
ncbi:MAG: peptidoglycan DD-metalloendopeptidase family protein [Cyanobacteria bacterium J06638_28]